MASLNTMVKRVSGLVNTTEVTAWEDEFIQRVMRQTSNGDNTTSLTEKQIDVLERLFNRHLSG